MLQFCLKKKKKSIHFSKKKSLHDHIRKEHRLGPACLAYLCLKEKRFKIFHEQIMHNAASLQANEILEFFKTFYNYQTKYLNLNYMQNLFEKLNWTMILNELINFEKRFYSKESDEFNETLKNVNYDSIKLLNWIFESNEINYLKQKHEDHVHLKNLLHEQHDLSYFKQQINNICELKSNLKLKNNNCLDEKLFSQIIINFSMHFNLILTIRSWLELHNQNVYHDALLIVNSLIKLIQDPSIANKQNLLTILNYLFKIICLISEFDSTNDQTIETDIAEFNRLNNSSFFSLIASNLTLNELVDYNMALINMNSLNVDAINLLNENLRALVNQYKIVNNKFFVLYKNFILSRNFIKLNFIK